MSSPRMDVKYINPFIASTTQVFKDMVHVSIAVGKPYVLKPQDQSYKQYDLSAVIGFTGPATGMVVLSVSEAVILALASGLLGVRMTRLSDQCYDALAELTNMIAGGAKKDIVADPPITMTIPRVMRSELVSYPPKLPVLVIPFQTEAGDMALQVAMTHQNRKTQSPPATQQAPAAASKSDRKQAA